HGRRANAEAERQHRDCREPAVAAELADGVSDVLSERVENRRASHEIQGPNRALEDCIGTGRRFHPGAPVETRSDGHHARRYVSSTVAYTVRTEAPCRKRP